MIVCWVAFRKREERGRSREELVGSAKALGKLGGSDEGNCSGSDGRRSGQAVHVWLRVFPRLCGTQERKVPCSKCEPLDK